MEKIIELTPIIISLIIAAIVAYIAYQQYKLAVFNTRRDTRRELYERRLPVYNSVMEFISKVITNPDVKIEVCHTLLKETHEKSFLFETEVKDYIDELYNKGVELKKVNKMMGKFRNDENKNEEYLKYCNKEEELLIWFSKQYDRSESIFGSYLKIDKN